MISKMTGTTTGTLSPRITALLCAAAALALSACNPQNLFETRNKVAVPTVPVDAPAEVQAALRDYDYATSSLRALYVDKDAVGAEWQKVVESGRAQIIESGSATQLQPSLAAAVQAIGESDIVIQAGSQDTQTAQPFGGIGVIPDWPTPGKDRLLLLSVLADGPAARAGLKPHDSIVAIDGAPVSGGAPVTETIGRMRGTPGSKIQLTVSTPGAGEREVSITRRVIVSSPEGTPISYRRLPGGALAYIAPNPSDMESMRDEVASALRELNSADPVAGLVLDLRLMRDLDFPVNAMLSLFVSGDGIGSISSRGATEKLQIAGKGVGGSQDLRLAILVSEMTSGQAEAFAGILQDLGRARVIGTKTRGRTAAVTRVRLPISRAEMLIPSGDYKSAKGTSWLGKGLPLDAAFEQDWSQYNDDSDTQLTKAVALLSS